MIKLHPKIIKNKWRSFELKYVKKRRHLLALIEKSLRFIDISLILLLIFHFVVILIQSV